MAGVRDSIERLLAGHEPYPALVMDSGWNRLLANHGTRAVHEVWPLSCSPSRSTSCG